MAGGEYVPNDEESLKANGTVTSAGNYTVGDKLIVTMTATGGKSPYTYKYEYAKNGENYSTYKENTAISSVTVPTDSWTANTDYYIKVTVTDSDNKTFVWVVNGDKALKREIIISKETAVVLGHDASSSRLTSPSRRSRPLSSAYPWTAGGSP